MPPSPVEIVFVGANDHRPASPNVQRYVEGLAAAATSWSARWDRASAWRRTHHRRRVLDGNAGVHVPGHVRGEPVDERADLYAVGVIFYRLLTGRLPFDADSTVIILQKHVSERPTALRAHRRDLPPWCDSIVQRAMAKRPAERFQTASEFRTALRRASNLAPHAFASEGHPGGVEAERPLAAGRARKTTMVLSRRAATAIRKSVRQRRVAVPHSALVAAILLLLLVQVAHSPATTRVDGPVEVASAAVLAPPPAVASPHVPASPPALASPALASPRALAPPATAAAAVRSKRPAKPQAVVSRARQEVVSGPRLPSVRKDWWRVARTGRCATCGW